MSLRSLPSRSTLHAVVLLGVASLSIATAAPTERANAPTGTPAWSPFAPVVDPVPPALARPDEDRAWNAPIDRFVIDALRSRGLSPAPAIDRRVYLRRVSYDLTGLPPTPAALDRYLEDSRDEAIARAAVVDRLLALRAHAERLAQHWLDVARYADSDGFAIDSERPQLWRYRDWVVRSFDEDRPFARFVREQIAGDLLAAEAQDPDRASEAIVAAGFLRLGPWEADNMVPELKRQDYLNEVTTAIGEVFLGLTVGCARCHDHKYDPVPTRDFYALQAFFQPTSPRTVDAPFTGEERRAGFEHARRSLSARRESLETARRRILHRARLLLAARDAKPAGALEEKAVLAAIQSGGDGLEELKRDLAQVDKDLELVDLARIAPRAVSVGDDENPPETFVLSGGDVTAPTERVEPAFPTAPQLDDETLREQLPALATRAQGRRRVLADWLASPENPLVPRVLVNRLWQHLLGEGIVRTANDFGLNGSGASHPELLDWLTARFLDGGGRTKPILRRIALSRVYRSATVHPDGRSMAARDPDNRHFWRAHRRRLDAEQIRDTLLAVSGRLVDRPGGPGFHERLPKGLGRHFPFFQWVPSEEDERSRRSLYAFQRRNLVLPFAEAFDVADRNASCASRQTSVTTPQVFALFNGQLAHDAARSLALRLVDEVGHAPDAQIKRLFRLALSRSPDEDELESTRRFLKSEALARRAGDRGASRPELIEAAIASLEALALVLLNSNELVYLE